MRPSNDREAITLILEGITEAGVRLIGVNDGEDDYRVDSVDAAVKHITDVDIASVVVKTPDNERGWVLFVQGNDPEEVAANYTVNLEPYIDPVVHPWWGFD